MKLTLILIFNILILNTTHSTEIIHKCEDLLRKKQYAEAVLYANKKLSSQHNDLIHFFCRGQASFALSNLDDAESDFEIISRNKKTVESNRFLSFLYLAKIYALQNNFDKAINLLTTKLEILKDKPAIRRIYLNELADIHSKNQQLNQAINCMYDSLSLSANDNDRAFAYKKLAFFFSLNSLFIF
jgi:tetratricopeptide (TPR) repeat protein